jgi:hypothetical protein
MTQNISRDVQLYLRAVHKEVKTNYTFTVWILMKYAVVYLVEALWHKPEGHGVRFLMMPLHFFNLSAPSSRTVALGFTRSLTGMSTRNFPGEWSAAGA